MKSILIKPKNMEERKAIVTMLRKMGVEFETRREPTNKEILASIQRGMLQAELHLQGKIKLKSARELLNEL